MLRTMLTNCTYLDGNLELTFLENRSYDLSFLKDIKEVRLSLSHTQMNTHSDDAFTCTYEKRTMK